MRIYHFSNEKLEIVRVREFGKNSYTLNDFKVSDLPRSFWFINPDEREGWFQNGIKHSVTVDSSQIYNLRENKLGLKLLNIDADLRFLKDAGFLGVQYKNVVNLFYDKEVENAL